LAHDKLMDRARDELFSHINRCGVLQASPEDQKTWMDETIDYLAERFPDLSDLHLDQLHSIGVRFCQPAIGHGTDNAVKADASDEAPVEAAADEAVEADEGENVEAEAVKAEVAEEEVPTAV